MERENASGVRGDTPGPLTGESHMKTRRRGFRIVLGLISALVLAGTALAGQLVGGPCRYDDVPGQATIVAVTPQETGNRLDVAFTFTPQKPLTNEPLYEPAKIRHLTLTGGQAPGPRFVRKYGIRPGRTVPCRMRLIRKGTCTPVLFAFPGIDCTHDPDARPAPKGK